jgi:endonuclease YncB( thermonuclease family)
MFKWIKKKMSCFSLKKEDYNVKNVKKEKKEKKIKKEKNTVTDLKNISYKETMIFIPQITCGKVIKVYDGDTITVASKLPFAESPIYRFSVRLRSIDSPEIKGASKKECELAIQARDALHHLIFGKIVDIRNNGKEKYGRLLADIYCEGIHINHWMVENNYAVKYNGGKKVRGEDWD